MSAAGLSPADFSPAGFSAAGFSDGGGAGAVMVVIAALAYLAVSLFVMVLDSPFVCSLRSFSLFARSPSDWADARTAVQRHAKAIITAILILMVWDLTKPHLSEPIASMSMENPPICGRIFECRR